MATKRKQYPSQARLRELFDYDPEGFLVRRWRDEKSYNYNVRMAGSRAGNIKLRKDGHVEMSLSIDGVYYNTANLIWIYHKGVIKDGLYVKCHGDIFSGLRIEDMYLSDKRSKSHIGRKTNNNKTGFMGVSKISSGRYQAWCKFDGFYQYIGVYETAQAAASAYDRCAFEYYGDGFIGNNSGCVEPEIHRVKIGNRPIKAKIPNSGFRGVCKNKSKWQSRISINGNKFNLGTFPTKEQAARAYNIAAYEHYGEHAILNDIPDPLGKLQSDEEDVF